MSSGPGKLLASSLVVALAAGCGAGELLDEPELHPGLEDAVYDASLSLSQAIEIADSEATGIPTSAHLDPAFTEDRYEVSVVDLRASREAEIQIDPNTGRTEDVDTDDADDDEIEDAQLIDRRDVTLAEAVDLAERGTHGLAYGVEVDEGVFRVNVLGDDELVEVTVSPTDGAVLHIESVPVLDDHRAGTAM